MLLAVIKQEGGCDYSIGCGIRVLELKSGTLAEAVLEVEDWLLETEGDLSYQIYDATLLRRQDD